MSVKIVETVQQKLSVTAYKLAKMIGVTQQTVRIWTGQTATNKPREGMNLRALCKLRKVSGMSWSKFGRELDAEFLSDD
jgi:DNA-binding transcriptional regulator YiaG